MYEDGAGFTSSPPSFSEKVIGTYSAAKFSPTMCFALFLIFPSEAMETPHTLNHLQREGVVLKCAVFHMEHDNPTEYLLTTLNVAHGILKSAFIARDCSVLTTTLNPSPFNWSKILWRSCREQALTSSDN